VASRRRCTAVTESVGPVRDGTHTIPLLAHGGLDFVQAGGLLSHTSPQAQAGGYSARLRGSAALPSRNPSGRFGMAPTPSPCLRMGAWISCKPGDCFLIQAPRRKPGDIPRGFPTALHCPYGIRRAGSGWHPHHPPACAWGLGLSGLEPPFSYKPPGASRGIFRVASRRRCTAVTESVRSVRDGTHTIPLLAHGGLDFVQAGGSPCRGRPRRPAAIR